MNHFVITITRTCGSGGTTIGKMLADDYGIDLYDRKLLRLASDDSGINEHLFAAADEDMKRSPLYKASKKVYNGELIPPESDDFTCNDNLFNYQAKVLKELAKRESYVVIGRAADYILKEEPNVIRVFIHADIDEKAAAKSIAHLNAYRSAYYKYHTGREWEDVNNYDLSLDTSKFTYEECVAIIKSMVSIKLHSISLHN